MPEPEKITETDAGNGAQADADGGSAEEIRSEIGHEVLSDAEHEETKRIFPNWRDVSPKQDELDRILIERTTGKVRTILSHLLEDDEIHSYHSYANAVSVRRLGFNDHGPVHARITTYNGLKLLRLLHEAGIHTSLELEEVGTFEDSMVAVALGCYLHDMGMAVTRESHERHSLIFADEFIKKYLPLAYPDDPPMRAVVRAMAHECIVGHMAYFRIHSVEAGVVLVADGTDMSRGRSRIPQMMSRDPVVGDMHRYSASSITRVDIGKGETKPVRITIHMENVTGLFQVEEVMMHKVKASPIMPHLELCALVGEMKPKFYLR